MTRTKKTAMIGAVLLGTLMVTGTNVMAQPHWRHRPRHHRPHRPHWSRIVGGILRQMPQKHYVPGHYVVEYQRVLVMPGHYETQTRRLLVEPAHFETKIVPAVTQTITKPDGSTEVVTVQPARTAQVWVPDRYETQTAKVWVPARYQTRAIRRFVPGHWTY